MPKDSTATRFPDINEKLNAPKKLSTFERERQEAESKRLREAVATQKALLDFEDSFGANDHDDERNYDQDESDPMSRMSQGGPPRPPPSEPRGRMGDRDMPPPRPYRREVAEFGSSGPPPTLKRKRMGETADENRMRLDAPKRFEGRSTSRERDAVPSSDDHAPDTNVRRPTALLHCLPLGMTTADVKAIMPGQLEVENVIFIPPEGTQRQSKGRSALVIAGAQTPVSEIDNTVSVLQGKYLGFGCYLNISRHISLQGGQKPRMSGLVANNNIETYPFGARPAVYRSDQQRSGGSLRNAPPPRDLDRQASSRDHRGRDDSGTRYRNDAGNVEVDVRVPCDISQLRLIHRTAELLLLHGLTFEAVLMSKPEVQQQEKWAWLFDSSSEAGVYYRWVVWKLAQGERPDLRYQSQTDAGPSRIFEYGPRWTSPTENPRYANVESFEQLVHDSAYESSEDESGDEGAPQPRSFNKQDGPAPSGGPGAIDALDGASTRPRYLNPYRRAKLTHLLSRLPESNALLRVGDVARVTNFVINNAGNGADEIVDMLLSNIENPFRTCVHYSGDNATMPEQANKDPSSAKLIGLYLVSDALQASSVSGVRDAWKYRTLFETALKERRIFEHLASVEKELDWGRMKSEQWKRKIQVVFGIWEAKSIFPKQAQDNFKKVFLEQAAVAGGGEKGFIEQGADRGAAGAWKKTSADAGQDELAKLGSASRSNDGGVDGQDRSKSQAQESKQAARPDAPSAHGTTFTAPGPSQTSGATTSTKRYRPTAAELNDQRLETSQRSSHGGPIQISDHHQGQDQSSQQPVSSPAGSAEKTTAPQSRAAPLGFSLSLGGAMGNASSNPTNANRGTESIPLAAGKAQRHDDVAKQSLDDMFDSD